jgi:hypothetical protein
LRHLRVEVDRVNLPIVTDPAQRIEAYAEVVTRVRELVQSCAPEGAIVAVVSRGDSDLLRFAGRIGWHFPRMSSGAYAGHHPADDADAIGRLEVTREDGAQFLVLPATAYWWLDHYAGLKSHLESRYRRVVEEHGVATVFSLEGVVSGSEPQADHALDALIPGVRAVAAALLPAGARVLVATGGDERLLDLGGPIGWHFPQREGGYYAGEDPADSSTAITELEFLREAGAGYLLIPRTAHWWLERFAEFRAHLGQTYSLVTRQQNVCTIYDLQPASPDHQIAVDSARHGGKPRPSTPRIRRPRPNGRKSV